MTSSMEPMSCPVVSRSLKWKDDAVSDHSMTDEDAWLKTSHNTEGNQSASGDRTYLSVIVRFWVAASEMTTALAPLNRHLTGTTARLTRTSKVEREAIGSAELIVARVALANGCI